MDELKPITAKVEEGNEVVLVLPKPVLEMLGLKNGETIKVSIHKLPENYNTAEIASKNFKQAMDNSLFKALIERIKKDYPTLKMKVTKSMVAFYDNKKGLLWVEYPRGRKIRVHLKKRDYSTVDYDKKVIPSGWGGYPEFIIEKEEDINYLIRLIKFATS